MRWWTEWPIMNSHILHQEITDYEFTLFSARYNDWWLIHIFLRQEVIKQGRLQEG